MSKLARWSRTEPNTCLDTSNAQTLTGRCGLSFHLLYTSARRARPPNAACTTRANDPSSLHSPLLSWSGCCIPAGFVVTGRPGNAVVEGGSWPRPILVKAVLATVLETCSAPDVMTDQVGPVML